MVAVGYVSVFRQALDPPGTPCPEQPHQYIEISVSLPRSRVKKGRVSHTYFAPLATPHPCVVHSEPQSLKPPGPGGPPGPPTRVGTRRVLFVMEGYFPTLVFDRVRLVFVDFSAYGLKE